MPKMPDSVAESAGAALKGDVLVPAGEPGATVARPVPHGHVAAVYTMALKLGLPALPGPARPRDLALALVISRAAHPGPKLPAIAWRNDVTPGAGLGTEDAATGEAYAAMDWPQARQETTEKKPARRHLAPEPDPSRMALPGLSSSWPDDPHCPPGYSRDGKKGKVQIEYGLLTDPEGRPVAIRVFEGNTADPAAFTAIAGVAHGTPGLKRMVMAGDRGMITTARIEAPKEPGEKYARITALRSPQIRTLMAGDGPLQLSLSDEQDLAEISSPGFPGERLIACRNPALAGERARKSEALLAATEKILAPSPPACRPAACPARTRPAGKRARSSASTRWPGTSTSPSPTTASPSSGTRSRPATRPGSTGSTSSAPPSPKPGPAPPPPSPPART